MQADILTSWIKLIQKSGTDMFICETTTIIHCSLSMMMMVMDMMVMMMMIVMMMMYDDNEYDDLNLPTTSLSEYQEQVDLALLS